MSRKSMLEALQPHKERMAAQTMRAVFDADPGRHARFSLETDGVLLDYSRNRVDAAAMEALMALARACGLEARREAMFTGQPINLTEGRAVLHTALRDRSGAPVHVAGADVAPGIAAVLAAMRRFASDLRGGAYAVTGGAVTDVVNIGIGGSDLGPAMAVRALSPYADGPRVHFVSNVDGADFADTVAGLDPARTLFIVASKTFTTAETMANANTARDWVAAAAGAAGAGRHFAALSTNLSATRAFGIPDERAFGFWDWVGGRYSIWSAIGLSLMIAIGPDRFDDFLDGGHAMDRHFREAPLAANMPVIMGMLGVWHRNAWGFGSHAVLPYDNRLARFPAYLQQLDMESNGKTVTHSGEAATWQTGPVVWGEPGTNGQHAFYQLIHQGTSVIPCDFLLAARPHEDLGRHHLMLSANCLAQSEALMRGRTLEEASAEMRARGATENDVVRIAPHRVFSGDRPSSTLLYPMLTPFVLGQLIALYEHKVFVQGAIWDVNSFDQWGVELGKVLAVEMEPLLAGARPADDRDSSTAGLVAAWRRMRQA